MNNVILVYEDRGQIKQRFCHSDEAKAAMEIAAENLQAAITFTVSDECGMDAIRVLSLSPDLAIRVSAAKIKMLADVRLRDALDCHGVPRDLELRRAIHRAYEDALQPLLNPPKP